MRAGEIQGLRVQDLGQGCLYIRHSWNEMDDYVFRADRKPDKPMEQAIFKRSLRKALIQTGMGEKSAKVYTLPQAAVLLRLPFAGTGQRETSATAGRT
jgi:hypothetical protein